MGLASSVRRRHAQSRPVEDFSGGDAIARRWSADSIACMCGRAGATEFAAAVRFFENIYDEDSGRAWDFIVTGQDEVRPMLAAAVFFEFGGHAIYKFGRRDVAFPGTDEPENLMVWESDSRSAERGGALLHFFFPTDRSATKA